MAACIKAVSPHIPLYEAVFFRCFVTALILAKILEHKKISLKANHFPLLVTRAFSGFLAISCNFYALAHLSLGDASMLVTTFPVFVTILSFIFLKERPTPTLIFWILTALIGIAFILRPQFNFFNYAGFIALLAAIFSAIVVVVIRQSHETDPSLRIAFYFVAIATLLSGPMMLRHFILPSLHETFFLVGAGLFGTAAQILMTRAYGLDEVSRLSPLAYASVVLAFIIGLIFWNEVPHWESLVGSLIVVICCIQIARIEKPPAVEHPPAKSP